MFMVLYSLYLDAPKPDIIIDALLGPNPFEGVQKVAELITWANLCKVSILSIDIPSGYDATMPALKIIPRWTCAMGLLRDQYLRVNVGSLFLCDVGIPAPFLRRRPEYGGELISPFNEKYLVSVAEEL